MAPTDATLNTPKAEAGQPANRGVRADTFGFGNVLGESAAIAHAIELARKVAGHPATTVLLQGETGTGKELFARGIHYAGTTADEPFVAINCSAIPEALLESELFGHEEGAFTDARARKRGLLELAGRGTVFLDEISELPLSLQPKLLRVLEEKRVRRLGGLEECTIECRIIVATNRDLAAAAHDGGFREDLYYRLNVFRIELPPLRDRGNDIERLARHFVASIARERDLPPGVLDKDALAVLRGHAWAGNVRELKNVIERAIILSENGRIGPEHILIQRRASVPAADIVESGSAAAIIRVPREGMTLEEAERSLLRITLRLVDNNRTRAAEKLGVSRPTIVRKIRKYGL